jgi:2-polyprenyl-3-methyl-5-hydroxy-6-metoxy-1,4-benzoquinol methylase
MKYDKFYKTYGHSYEEYERSHKPRLDFLLEDLKVDLDNFNINKNDFFDAVLCFETIEHLTNPYNCLLEIKNILKKDHLLYLTIPESRTEHNTIYPGLIYPVQNFIKFLEQWRFK